MKKLTILALLCAAACFGQTTINITITIPAGAVAVENAWVPAVCLATDTKGVCIQAQYKDLTDAVTNIVNTALNAQVTLPAMAWAVSTKDATLAKVSKDALVAASAAGVVVDAAKTAAALAAQYPIAVTVAK